MLFMALGIALPSLGATASAGSLQDLKDQAKCTPNQNVQCIDQTPDPATSVNCTQEGQSCNLISKYVNPLIKLLGILVGLAVTMGIIIGGIQYASSGGDPQRAANGKKHIVQSIIALVAFFFLYAFLGFLIPGQGLLIK